MDQFKLSWSEFPTLSWQEGALALQKNSDEDIDREPQFLWDFLPPSCPVDPCIQQAASEPLQVAATTATFSTNVFNAFFPWSCFMTDVFSFLQNWYRCFADFQCLSNAFETINHQCYNTELSNLLYKEWKKNNLPYNFPRYGNLLTQQGKHWLFMEQVLSLCSLLPVYECLCSL